MLNRHDRAHSEVVVRRGGRRHDEEEHGGAWKVAFADFCLALMCLFLVLWVLAARDKEEVQRMFGQGTASSMLRDSNGRQLGVEATPPGTMIGRDPVLSRHPGGAPANQALQRLESREDLERLSQQVRAVGNQLGLQDHLETMVTAEGLRVLIHDTEHEGMFRVGSSEPSGKFAALLQRIGPLFQRIGNQLVIVGHTDARAFAGQGSNGASNWSLSSERALAARTQMMRGGMPDSSVLQVMGMADAAPVDPAHPLAAVNRRVELLVTTQEHARGVAATFGRPGHTEPLTPDVLSSRADTPILQSLRALLLGRQEDAPAP